MVRAPVCFLVLSYASEVMLHLPISNLTPIGGIPTLKAMRMLRGISSNDVVMYLLYFSIVVVAISHLLLGILVVYMIRQRHQNQMVESAYAALNGHIIWIAGVLLTALFLMPLVGITLSIVFEVSVLKITLIASSLILTILMVMVFWILYAFWRKR